VSAMETWSKTVLVQSDCLTCGKDAGHLGTGDRDQDRARRWARKHVTDNPGHHAIVEVTRGRSYRSEATP
jgi:hypothetical protein